MKFNDEDCSFNDDESNFTLFKDVTGYEHLENIFKRYRPS